MINGLGVIHGTVSNLSLYGSNKTAIHLIQNLKHEDLHLRLNIYKIIYMYIKAFIYLLNLFNIENITTKSAKKCKLIAFKRLQ